MLYFALSGPDHVWVVLKHYKTTERTPLSGYTRSRFITDSDDPGNSITICRYCMGREGSPDLMPLEEIFNQVKSIMKQNCTLFQACSAPRVFLLMAFSFVSVENCIGYIHHSGYIQ